MLAQVSSKGVGGREENRPATNFWFLLSSLWRGADGGAAVAPPLCPTLAAHQGSCWCSRKGLIVLYGKGGQCGSALEMMKVLLHCHWVCCPSRQAKHSNDNSMSLEFFLWVPPSGCTEDREPLRRKGIYHEHPRTLD